MICLDTNTVIGFVNGCNSSVRHQAAALAEVTGLLDKAKAPSAPSC
jgi:hypothetical protein